MLLIELAVGALILFAVAAVAAGRGDSLARAWSDRPRPVLPDDRSLTASDVEQARFGVGFRGYRMDEVDELLDRLAHEVAERDARLAALEAPGVGPVEGSTVEGPIGPPR